MKILALDTATPVAGIALLDGGRLVGALAVPAERGHAGHLLSSVRFLLERAGWPASAPDLFVATSGPGSFTGLRIGLGTIEGLALAAGRPAAGVSTLAAMACAIGPVGIPLLPLLDAGRGEVFAGIYSGEEPPQPLEEERALRPDDLAGWLGRFPGGPLLAAGPGAHRYAEALRAACPAVRILPAGPNAAAGAGRLAGLLIAAGADPSSLPLTARYLRRADVRLPGGGSG